MAWAKTVAVVVPSPAASLGFGSGLANQGDAGVFNVVFQFDFFGDGDTVVDDLRGTVFFLQYYVAPFRTQGDGDGFG